MGIIQSPLAVSKRREPPLCSTKRFVSWEVGNRSSRLQGFLVKSRESEFPPTDRDGVIFQGNQCLKLTPMVWNNAHGLTLGRYELTAEFPREDIYGLTSQLGCACASIPTNISEGCGRESPSDFARFLQIAGGSASETEYPILLAHTLNYLNADSACWVNRYNRACKEDANVPVKDD